jgi:hypothetical protein
VPTNYAIHKIVKKFKTTGSVLNKEIKRSCHIFSEEKHGDIIAWIEQSQRKSLTSQQAAVSYSSA